MITEHSFFSLGCHLTTLVDLNLWLEFCITSSTVNRRLLHLHTVLLGREIRKGLSNNHDSRGSWDAELWNISQIYCCSLLNSVLNPLFSYCWTEDTCLEGILAWAIANIYLPLWPFKVGCIREFTVLVLSGSKQLVLCQTLFLLTHFLSVLIKIFQDHDMVWKLVQQILIENRI